METMPQIFTILLLAGLILLGAEIFVPGGVLGVIGALCLLGAIITGLYAFPGRGGYVAFGVILLIGVAMGLWITIFPRTRIGKRMAVATDLRAAKAADNANHALVGKEGVAVSDLRPAGYALLDGRRVDVLTQGEMISKGMSVKVVHVEGNRVFVARI